MTFWVITFRTGFGNSNPPPPYSGWKLGFQIRILQYGDCVTPWLYDNAIMLDGSDMANYFKHYLLLTRTIRILYKYWAKKNEFINWFLQFKWNIKIIKWSFLLQCSSDIILCSSNVMIWWKILFAISIQIIKKITDKISQNLEKTFIKIKIW